MPIDKISISKRWWMSFMVVGILVVTWSCQKRPPQHQVTLAVLTQLEGTLAPCGCTSRPLGGLDRVAALLASEAKETTVLTLVSGDTFFNASSFLEGMHGQAQAAAETIADVLVGMGQVILAPGRIDEKAMQKGFEVPQRVSKLWGTSANDAFACQMVAAAGLQLGFIRPRATAMSADISEVLDEKAQQLRQKGAQGVVVLWPDSSVQAQQTLGSLANVDLIIASGDGPPRPLQPLGKGWLLDAGARGEYVGMVRLSLGEGGRFALFDGGHQAQEDAKARITRLLREAQALPAGPGRQARESRAAKLQASLPSLVAERPATAIMTAEFLPMDVGLEKAPWATEALRRFDKALCTVAEADTAKRTCAPAPTPSAQYAGSAACQSCHPQAWAVYKRTRHSKAWSTLTQANKQCDLTCVGCHVVGFEKPGGFCHLADAPKWANVGCESCHGPAKGHIANPYDRSQWAENFVRDTPEATCKGCHNATHSDQFDFATYRPKILGLGHGLKAP